MQRTQPFTFRRFSLALGITIGAALGTALPSPAVTAGGLQNQLDGIFSDMTNFTAPGKYDSVRRGVLFGGEYVAKSRISGINLVSFMPPSLKAGCGGIDLFGGSFSFVNSDQLVQFLRQVGANSAGYAFELALKNVAPDIANVIETMQQKVQQLNQMFSNSCQLAQGLVNDATSAFDIKHKTNASVTATVKGIAEDFFSSSTEESGASAPASIKANDPTYYKEHMIGNIVWKQLNKNGVSGWFDSGDNDFMEAMMSLSGSIIVEDQKPDPNDPNGGGTTPIRTLVGHRISYNDLLNGGDVAIYSCAGDTQNCLSAGLGTGGTRTVTLKGLRQKMTDMLLGGPSGPGIISKFRTGAAPLTPEEQNFITALPQGVGAMVKNLAGLSDKAAELFVNDASGAITLSMAHDFVADMLRTTRIALSNSDSTYAPQALEVIQKSRTELDGDYDAQVTRYGRLSDVIQRYNLIIDNTRKRNYVPDNARDTVASAQ